MADIRINSLPTTASASSSDDFLALDGATNGTRKLNAYSPTFGGNVTASGNLTVSGVTTSAGISNSGALTFTAAIGQVAGSIAKNATYGLTYYGVTGSSNDNTMLNASGAVVLSNPAGTTNATLTGNLTVSGTTGVTATDLTLGSSGPSVKSTLSARAPRQGLVFDGTAGATGTAVTIGTADLTFSQWVRVPSTVSETRGLFLLSPAGSIGATSLLGYVDSDATLNIHITGATSGDRTKQTLSGFVTSYAGKWVNILFTRVGSTWTGYINGVATTFSASTSGTAPTWAGSISGAVVNFGSLGSSGAIYNDAISAINLYNRALSASEVVSLYEAGAPAGADYNSASNTAINSSAWVNTNYTSFSGASATGFTAVKASSTGYAESRPTFSIQKGQKFRFTGTLTLNNGKTVLPYVLIQEDATAVQIPASGSFDVTVTAGITMSGATAYFRTSGDADYTVSNVSVTRLGLLLAPDAAQAGGGLVWYDTSGNAANITLPASGVSWNVPSSAKVATGWAFGGNVGIGSTSIPAWSSHNVLQTSDLASFGSFTGNKNAQVMHNAFWNGSAYKYIETAASSYYAQTAGVHSWFTAASGTAGNTITFAEAARITSGGNVLIGTTTDSANGKLQLATHTTSAGGIGFGTDTALYRAAAQSLNLDGASSPQFSLSVSGTQKARFESYSDDLYISTLTAGKSIILRSGNATTALTLDSSQNATFAGTVTGTQFKSASGSTSAADGVATTVLSLSGKSGQMYLVHASLNGVNDAGNYAAFATVVMDGTSARIVSNNGTYMTLTLSGTNVQATQTSGVTQTIVYKYTSV